MFKVKRRVVVNIDSKTGNLYWQWLCFKGIKKYNKFKLERTNIVFDKPLKKGTDLELIYSRK